MRRPEIHGLSTNNTVRRIRYKTDCNKCPDCGCSQCSTRSVWSTSYTWGYSSRKNNINYRKGFHGYNKGKCPKHGHRFCGDNGGFGSKVPRTYKEQVNPFVDEDYDHNENCELEELYELYMEEEKMEEECKEDTETLVLDYAYSEYEKMREEEVDIESAYNEYLKMKEEEWIILELNESN